jgi:flagellin-like protein
MNKKAISGIVAAVIMIALVIAITGIVWVVVTNLVTEQLGQAGTCLDVLGKISINHQYTCYNATGGNFQFSLGIADVDVEKVLVSVSGGGTTKSYEITQESSTQNGLTFYNGSANIWLPEKNEGFTYILDTEAEGLGKPDEVRIYPIIGGRQCDSSDSISQISSCISLLD